MKLGASLGVQWLRLYAPKAGGSGSIDPWSGKILHTARSKTSTETEDLAQPNKHKMKIFKVMWQNKVRECDSRGNRVVIEVLSEWVALELKLNKWGETKQAWRARRWCSRQKLQVQRSWSKMAAREVGRILPERMTGDVRHQGKIVHTQCMFIHSQETPGSEDQSKS